MWLNRDLCQLYSIQIMFRGSFNPSITRPFRGQHNISRVLENGLSLTSSFAPNGDISSGSFSRSSPVVFAVDFTGLTGSAGLIFELGGSGNGFYGGFDATNLVVRAGSGGARWDANTSYLLADKPTGDGTLVFGAYYNPELVPFAYWNGEPVNGTTVVGLSSDVWGGTDDAAFLAAQSGSNSNIVNGEVATPTTGYTTASDLRYYENQTLNV